MIKNGLTPEQYEAFHAEYADAPCTREAIEALQRRYFPTAHNAHYPDQYYADKNNRIAGEPTGHMRCLVTQGGRMVWVKYLYDENKRYIGSVIEL